MKRTSNQRLSSAIESYNESIPFQFGQEFEKKKCKEMETVLKSKVFNWSQPANPATTLTAILVLNYMKTFDNPDTIDFRKGISAYSNKWHLQDYQPIYGYSDCYRDKVALLMNRELLTRINLPIVELLIGETIKETTQSYV